MSAAQTPHLQPTQAPTERRRSARQRVGGRVTALTGGLGPNPTSKRISSLQLQDMSDGGIGALTEQPLETGERIALLFPPHGPHHGFDLYGTVVRRRQLGDRHEVGIELDHPMAA